MADSPVPRTPRRIDCPGARGNEPAGTDGAGSVGWGGADGAAGPGSDLGGGQAEIGCWCHYLMPTSRAKADVTPARVCGCFGAGRPIGPRGSGFFWSFWPPGETGVADGPGYADAGVRVEGPVP